MAFDEKRMSTLPYLRSFGFSRTSSESSDKLAKFSVLLQAGLRDIPIHNDILAFVDLLIAESTDGYLLPNEPEKRLGERSSAIGKRFGRLKTQLGYDGRYVFHSLRKTMVTQLEMLGLHHNEAAEIIGHEKVGETYGRYFKGLTISKKSDIVNRIKLNLFEKIDGVTIDREFV